MRFLIFLSVVLITLILLYSFNKNGIHDFFSKKNNKIYICWIIMLLSNLGFSQIVQYPTRMIGIVVTIIVLSLVSKNTENKVSLKLIQFLLLVTIAFYFI